MDKGTPWTTDSYGDWTNLHYSGGGMVGRVLYEEDAAFIVKAVNNHDKLAEALEGFLEQIPALRDNEGNWGAINDLEDRANALLAALKEQP